MNLSTRTRKIKSSLPDEVWEGQDKTLVQLQGLPF